MLGDYNQLQKKVTKKLVYFIILTITVSLTKSMNSSLQIFFLIKNDVISLLITIMSIF